MAVVTLASETDLAGFRAAVRRLLAEDVPPPAVQWRVEGDGSLGEDDVEGPADGPGDPDAATASAPTGADAGAGAPIRLPAFAVTLVDSVLLHRDPGRFELAYRLLWRARREPGLRHDALDPDRVLAERLSRAVTRDQHKMKAFVRFRPVGGSEPDSEGWHVAWFEPEHHVVEATAPFFARRFANLRWAILTPRRSVRWDGHGLRFGAGASRADAPAADAGEALWLTYYASIFNPARLKLAMMRKEMPRRYWANLPEAVLIEPLSRAAAERSGRMIDAEPAAPLRRLPRALPPVVAEAGAREHAAPSACATLEALGRAMQACRACPIGELATQAVPGQGPRQPWLMVVGEQPGDQEDLAGRPFVGPAGRLFDRALGQLGWDRATLYVTNAVKHFRFELRGRRRIHKTPAQQEAAACLDWLEREIALAEPGALLALGATAARALLGHPVPVTGSRGQWFQRADGRRVLVTLHPSALLRLPPDEQGAAWTAWLADLARADALRPRAAAEPQRSSAPEPQPAP